MSAKKKQIDKLIVEMENFVFWEESVDEQAKWILDRQERRERELLKAVYRYGIHDFECPARKAWGLQKISPECSCGLKAILARLDGKRKVKPNV